MILRPFRVAQRIVVFICNHSPKGKKHGKASLRTYLWSLSVLRRLVLLAFKRCNEADFILLTFFLLNGPDPPIEIEKAMILTKN